MPKHLLKKNLFLGDRSIWILFLLLSCFSIIVVFSATSTLAYKQTSIWNPIARHASFLLAGVVLILFIIRIPYRFFSLGILLIPLSFILLLLTPIIGIKTNDASRWIELLGVRFQPSEFGKLACIIYTAFMLSKLQKFPVDLLYKYLLWGIFPICGLIMIYNLSTAALLFGVCFILMFIGQVPLKKMGKTFMWMGLAGLIAISLSIVMPETTSKYVPRLGTWTARITEFRDKEKKPSEEHASPKEEKYIITDKNYQVTHAKIAIARGGLLGKMPGHSVQRDFLPQAYSDFIYAIIIEELGIVGGFFVLLLYIILLIRVGVIAQRCEKLFPKYLVLGCGLLIVIQALAHMAVAVNLFPVTGQPLPLISRGGTSTMITCIYFGIILSVSHFGAGMGQEEEKEAEANEEIDESEEEIEVLLEEEELVEEDPPTLLKRTKKSLNKKQKERL